MNETTNDTLLDMLRQREKQYEREYVDTLAKTDTMIAVANARLTEVRELIEKLTTKRRGRPPREAQVTVPTLEPESVEVEV